MKYISKQGDSWTLLIKGCEFIILHRDVFSDCCNEIAFLSKDQFIRYIAPKGEFSLRFISQLATIACYDIEDNLITKNNNWTTTDNELFGPLPIQKINNQIVLGTESNYLKLIEFSNGYLGKREADNNICPRVRVEYINSGNNWPFTSEDNYKLDLNDSCTVTWSTKKGKHVSFQHQNKDGTKIVIARGVYRLLTALQKTNSNEQI